MTTVVAFVSQKGGVGKSTLARALAAIAAKDAMSVRLADVDWRQQTAKHWADMRNEIGIEPPIDCQVYENALDAIDEAHDVDLLVIDLPGYASELTVELAQHADLIIEPTGPSIDDMRPGVLTLYELAQAGVEKDKLAVALFRVAIPKEEKRARAYMGEYGYDVLDGHLPEKSSLRDLQDEGHSVCEGKQSKLSGSADKLMAAMITKLAQRMDARDRDGVEKDNQPEPSTKDMHTAQRGARKAARTRDERDR